MKLADVVTAPTWLMLLDESLQFVLATNPVIIEFMFNSFVRVRCVRKGQLA